MRLLTVLLFVLGLALHSLGNPLPDITPINGTAFGLIPKPTHSKSADGIPHESHTFLNNPGTLPTLATTIVHTTPTVRPYGGPRPSLKPSAWITSGASGNRPTGSPKSHGSGLIASGATGLHPTFTPSNPHGRIPTLSWTVPHANSAISPTHSYHAPQPTSTTHSKPSHPAWNNHTPAPCRPTDTTQTDRPEASGKTTRNAFPATPLTGPTGGESDKHAGSRCENPQVNPNPPFNFLCPGDEGYCENLVLNNKPPYGLICADE